MILHHRLPQFTSQLRTQLVRRTCIFIPNRMYRTFNDANRVNPIELHSLGESTITGVTVYPTRAEITRLFKFNVMKGQNQLNISGLPTALDRDSLRVEGRGAATIHGVTVSNLVSPSISNPTDSLKILLNEKVSIENEMRIESKHLRELGYEMGDIAKHDTDGDADEFLEMKDELAKTEAGIAVEIARYSGHDVGKPKPKPIVSIGVFAALEGKINIALIYAVHNVTWKAGYDIHVDTKRKDKPVTLTYKAGITQNTGEDWNDVPLTFETATPTFGLRVPTLSPWNISFYRQRPIKSKYLRLNAPNQPVMQEHYMDASSTGNVGATFRVPSLISIPSDGMIHNVTIAKLDLDAKMSWVCVPKKDAKTYLIAKIKNESPYTFMSGQSSVNVDGSIISNSDVPHVNPEESFDCPLNVDPSIGVRYHPRAKKVIQRGIYTKTTNHVFSQRITIANSNTLPIENLKIIDQVPVSEDPRIAVKLVRPALGVPGEDFGWGSAVNEGEPKVLPPVSVAPGVVAQWNGADEANVGGGGALGKDGNLNWVCAVPAQEKIGLVLQWEVVAPAKTTTIPGLAS